VKKVLCDEPLPHKLRHALTEFETVTVQYAGFSGLKNGQLLSAAQSAGFDVFITGDRTLEYEQNLKGRTIAVVSLSAAHWAIIQDHVGKIAVAVEMATPGSLTRVDCGRFARPKRKLNEPERY
jgi:hypothetical protein